MNSFPNPTGNIVLIDSTPGQVIGPTLINTYSALTVPAYWRAITFLADNLASFPRAVHLKGRTVDQPHPLDKILQRRPNQLQTSYTFWRTFFGHAAHYGNGYAQIVTDGINPTGLYNLLPDYVTPFRYEGQQWYYYALTKSVLAAADILHVSGFGYDGMQGYNPIWLMAETFQRAVSIDKFTTRYIQRGTVLRGSIEIPAGATPERQQEIVDALRNQFAGDQATGDVIVLSDGATLNNKTLTPEQSQLIQQGEYTTKQIAQITGVPPRFLFEGAEAKYNNAAEASGSDVVAYCFRLWFENIQDELSGKLLSEAEQDQGYRITVNPDALLRGATSEQIKNVTTKVNQGLITPNEGRRELGLPDDPDPTSNNLRTPAGQLPPVPTPENAKSPQVDPPADSPDAYGAIKPILIEAAERVERKTEKAFADAERKTPEQRTIWGNVFAEQQAGYIREAFSTLAVTVHKLTGKTLDVEKLADQYAMELKRRATVDGHEARTLAALLEGDNGTN